MRTIPPRIELLTTGEQFGSIANEWDALLCATPRPSPYLLFGWISEWWARYGEGRSALRVVTAWRDGHLVAALPTFVRRRQGFRVVEFLGGKVSLADLLLLPSEPDSTAVAILDALRSTSFDMVDLARFPAGGVLARVGPSLGLHLVTIVGAPVMLLPEGWEAAYAAKIGASQQKSDRRRDRQLGAAGRLEFRVASTPAEVDGALGECFRLHTLRWAGRADGSVFGTDHGQQFQRSALKRLAASEVVRIGLLTLDNRAIAFEAWFQLGEVAVFHRTGFDPAFARYSPGLLAVRRALSAASAEGVCRVELLGGDEPYKLRFADSAEMLCQGLGLAQGIRGQIRTVAQSAAIRGHRILRRSTVVRRIRRQLKRSTTVTRVHLKLLSWRLRP